MNVIYFIVLLGCAFSTASAEKLDCTTKKPNITEVWLDMVDPCIDEMRSQIQKELNAAMTYLAMGAHFSRDTINRPGFAKMFFESASEERGHAIKLISYLLMRGELKSKVSSLIDQTFVPKVTSWDNAFAAMTNALELEATVTKSIREVIKKCEGTDKEFNDYHLVDYLTGEFLEEQYHGQRELAGKLSTLGKMMESHGVLGEFLYDKTLLG